MKITKRLFTVAWLVASLMSAYSVHAMDEYVSLQTEHSVGEEGGEPAEQGGRRSRCCGPVTYPVTTFFLGLAGTVVGLAQGSTDMSCVVDCSAALCGVAVMATSFCWLAHVARL